MIKYLGSKRRLVPVLGAMAQAVQVRSALDLFTGTTRVAQEFKRRRIDVTAVDLATYSKVLGDCYITTDADAIDADEITRTLAELNALPGERGYVTRTFCEASRYFQPKNGLRIDAIRAAIERDHAGSALHPIVLTSLLEAADRVDSTTGLQMAYLKQWAPRSHRDLELRLPDLIAGTGTMLLADVNDVIDELPAVDLAYLDPPYNQHRYFTNYHVWETLVRWDAPEHYGIACKRIDARDPATKSVFNRKRQMPDAFADLLGRVRADMVVVSYNDEAWIGPDRMVAALHDAGHEEVQMVGFDSRRYVGAQIGVHSPAGQRVGEVSHLHNTEFVFIAGDRTRVAAAVASTGREAVGVA